MFRWFKSLFSRKKIEVPSPEFIELFTEFEEYRQHTHMLISAITLKHKGELFIEQEFINMAVSGGYQLSMEDMNNGVHFCVFQEDEEHCEDCNSGGQ